MVYAIAVFAPLVGALISGLLGRAIGDRASMCASILGMLIAAVCGPYAFFTLVPGGELSVVDLGTWIEAGKFHVSWALRYDTLAAVLVARNAPAMIDRVASNAVCIRVVRAPERFGVGSRNRSGSCRGSARGPTPNVSLEGTLGNVTNVPSQRFRYSIASTCWAAR